MFYKIPTFANFMVIVLLIATFLFSCYVLTLLMGLDIKWMNFISKHNQIESEIKSTNSSSYSFAISNGYYLTRAEKDRIILNTMERYGSGSYTFCWGLGNIDNACRGDYAPNLTSGSQNIAIGTHPISSP